MKSIKKEYQDRIEYHNEKGECHRTDGPAVEWTIFNRKEWFINGKRHREDGPAIIFSNGRKEWWINGQHCTEKYHQQELTNIKLKRILEL